MGENITIKIKDEKDIIWHEPLDPNWFKYKKDIFQQLIPEGSVVIDIGAHCGVFSLWFGCCVGEKGKVIAFEPNPTTYNMLNKYSDLNDLNIIAYKYAVTPETKQYTFNYTNSDKFGTATNGGFFNELDKKEKVKNIHTQEIKVEGVNLYDFLSKNHKEDIEKIKLIKIDTEGNDKEIIKTLDPIIKKSKPLLVVEAFEHLSTDEIIDYFNSIKSHNYEIYDISPMDNLVDCMGPLSLEEFEHNIYHVNKNGNFLCVHKDDVALLGLPTITKNKISIIIVDKYEPNRNLEECLLKINKSLESFDEVIYIDFNSENSIIWELGDKLPKTGKITHYMFNRDFSHNLTSAFYPDLLKNEDLKNYFNQPLSFNIGLKRTDAELVAFSNITSEIPTRSDINKLCIDKNTLYQFNSNFQIASKNLWLRIKGLEERMVNPENIGGNIERKLDLNCFKYKDLSTSSQPIQKNKNYFEWVERFTPFIPEGFHPYEYFISRNHLYWGANGIAIGKEIY